MTLEPLTCEFPYSSGLQQSTSNEQVDFTGCTDGAVEPHCVKNLFFTVSEQMDGSVSSMETNGTKK